MTTETVTASLSPASAQPMQTKIKIAIAAVSLAGLVGWAILAKLYGIKAAAVAALITMSVPPLAPVAFYLLHKQMLLPLFNLG